MTGAPAPEDAPGPGLDPAARAAAFCREETAFRLGALVTESSHPKTATLSATAERDLAAAVRQLQSVDRDLPPVLARTLAGEPHATLVASLTAALRGGHRVFVSGCGATGRLALLLESLWRRACADPGRAHLRERLFGFMAGGDYALIKSVEGFEDHPSFGRRQLADAGPTPDDVLIAVTEGGETPFVIGTAWEALSRGMAAFFVFNNPAALLRERVRRSRELLDDPRVTAIDLCSGPMGVAGSTRMQATTIELAAVGAALEDALLALEGRPRVPADERVAAFGAVLDRLEAPEAVAGLARWADAERRLYEAGSRVRYLADDLLLDVVTDTTERSPTFSLPPFRPRHDAASPRPWANASHPDAPADRGWFPLLGRPVRGIGWTADDYAALGAPALAAAPPPLDTAAIEAFDVSGSATDGPRERFTVDGRGGRGLAVRYAGDTLLEIDLGAPPRPGLNLSHHLLAKLAFNTVSTATMAAMGRLSGNWMVHVRASNKKLIDRGIRLLVDQLGLPYEEAAERLFAAQAEVDAWPAGEEPPSPVALVIRRSPAA
ncbi:hypothetical protein [Phycisphaera mikurensis]|uniref:SIS domain-containing protein n=1 Tax=Phycisphaera mikurensis (strain NBRC 102666 / KCTC 22515 / FYK2301M01) TaxID=1142394 RepID=I0IDW1_PHYMF|nr:hypothetical protein [Phycisphaera mikurensis]MBB6441256.1 N-acetylmuramic acid 6-phosphate etherase [Phycisphaera mikurensis]BAM03449.1 hypothetical protein PSMK_12900 [Phycisphaera mikurensis NBRC 102666]